MTNHQGIAILAHTQTTAYASSSSSLMQSPFTYGVEAQIHAMSAVNKDDHCNSLEIVSNKQTEQVI